MYVSSVRPAASNETTNGTYFGDFGMKMQEVITALRKEVPALAKCKDEAGELQRKAWNLFDDLRRCESDEARRLLYDAFGETMNRFGQSLADLYVHVESLQRLNAGYTRKLGAKPKKAEDPRQMKLDLGEVK